MGRLKRLDPLTMFLSALLLCVVAGALGAAAILWFSDWKFDTIRKWAGPLSTGVAATSLVLAAATFARTSRRARQQSTMDAWGAWNDSTRNLRRQQRNKYPQITEGIAKELADLTAKSVADSAPGPERELAKDAHTTSRILTGLERIASGWAIGLYDYALLEKLGPTIIIRLYRRYEPYIIELRKSRDQDAAYENLQKLKDKLARANPKV